jgi:hypothetical protein
MKNSFEDKKTHIHFILDRSGSMWEIKNDTIGGFNSFITQQLQNNDDKCYMSLYQFDHEYQIVYENKEIKDVKFLDDESFIPRGQTSLLDAIGRTVCSITKNENTKNIVVILTDGFENTSKEYRNEDITKLIKEKENDNVEFVFLGANQDAIQTASKIGISANSAMTYCQSPENVRECFNGLSEAISRTRSGHESHICFTPAERSKSCGTRNVFLSRS